MEAKTQQKQEKPLNLSKVNKVFAYRISLNGVVVKTIPLDELITLEQFKVIETQIAKENPEYIINISYYHQNKIE